MKSTLPVGQIGLFGGAAGRTSRPVKAELAPGWSYQSEFTFQGERRPCAVVVLRVGVEDGPTQTRRSVDVFHHREQTALEGFEGRIRECEEWLAANGIVIPEGGLLRPVAGAEVLSCGR